jgi:hypothetical protein
MNHLAANKREDPFNYAIIAKTMWRKIIKDAQEKFNVFFDLENDYASKEIKNINVDRSDHLSEIPSVFKCQLYHAGSDWEWPVSYFRCQLTKGYAKDISEYDEKTSGCFVFIPGADQGNGHLIKSEKGSFHLPDSNQSRENAQTIRELVNDKKCWESVDSYLNDLVEQHVEEVKNPKDINAAMTFASSDEAMIYLAHVTNKRIIVAENEDNETKRFWNHVLSLVKSKLKTVDGWNLEGDSVWRTPDKNIAIKMSYELSVDEFVSFKMSVLDDKNKKMFGDQVFQVSEDLRDDVIVNQIKDALKSTIDVADRKTVMASKK